MCQIMYEWIFPCIDWREQALAKYDNKMEKKPFWINQYLILNTHPGVCCSEHPRLIDSFWDVAITYWHFSSFENLAWYWVLTFLFTIDIFVNVFHSIWNVCTSKVAFLQRFFCSSTPWRQQVGFQLLILKKTNKGTWLLRLLDQSSFFSYVLIIILNKCQFEKFFDTSHLQNKCFTLKFKFRRNASKFPIFI